MVAAFPLLRLARDGEEKRGGRFDGRQSFCFFDFNAKHETRDSYAFTFDERRAAP